MKKILLTSLFLLSSIVSFAQIQIQTSELNGVYKYSTSDINNFGIHDPSVVWDSQTQSFYVYGSHYVGAKTTNFQSWTGIYNYYSGNYDSKNAYKAFKSCPTHVVKRCLPGKSVSDDVTLPSFDAGAFCSIYAKNGIADWVSGDQWAPDIIFNPNTNKWYYYLSLNGDNWASVIVLMTADKPTGPFKYEAPIVFGGFNNQEYDVNGTKKKVNYKDTDLEIVLGEQSSLPGRYKTSKWGSFWPNCIDPCVFFDKDGELWLTYGSWSGGIWILKLDKNTGLRDYTYTYSGTANSVSTQQTSDAYFGKLIAGGCYVSGEGSYVQRIGDYYYLFMSYGFFSPEGGYEMRIFRSENPDGPYVDASKNDAKFSTYMMNYGPKSQTNRGMRLIGSYDGWGTQTLGQCALGHNSACQDDKGRTFMVCHTKSTDGSAGHVMRVHQLFQNQYGWLVAAPFVYDGESLTDADIASSQPWSASDIEGDYHVLLHPYKMDYENLSVSTPKTIHLSADGKVSGAYTGSWAYAEEGKSYIKITLAGVTYHGVVSEQTIQGLNEKYRTKKSTAKALCFSAICNTSGNKDCGVTVWGYKMQAPYAIAYNYQTYSDYFKVTSLSSIKSNTTLMFDPEENVRVSWKSSDSSVLTDDGKYKAPAEDTKIKLTARLQSGNYYWENEYESTIRAGAEVTGEPKKGLVAYYDFDDIPTYNNYDNTQKITYAASSTTMGSKPELKNDWARFGNVVHQYFGAQGANSYSRMPNPLLDKNFDGFSVSLWVKRADANNYYDALWSFFSGAASKSNGPRLYFTGNSYVGFNDDAGNWFDINHPDSRKVTTIPEGKWALVTFTYSKENGPMLYKDGTKYLSLNMKYTGSVAKETDFDRSLVLDFVKSARYFYLGLGSFWGSAEAEFDDLMIYDRELSEDDVKGLATLQNRVTDFSPSDPTSIENIRTPFAVPSNGSVYDLQGRKVMSPSKGMYIINGKKILIK